MNEDDLDLRLGKIDIKQIFYDKNASMARLLPNFFFNYLKKIVHEDFINDFISRHGEKTGMDFAKATIREFNNTCHVTGEENIEINKKYIVVSNHPLGGFDALLLLTIFNKYFPNVKFLVNDILMNVKNLRPLFIPINKHGGQPKLVVKKLHEAYISDNQIFTFPAGIVSRKINRKIQDPVWQKNFIIKSLQYQRDVIPVYISGRNSNFFYNLSNIRKFFGIKLNLEMLYLVDETMKHKNKNIEINIGKPIAYQSFDKSKTPSEWAKYVRQIVYSLPQNN